ncbi:MAG: YfcE family phosphodiesterase [Clostridia bacterium]|nr:YfcE family phosphodiesterase [Clostridia bacterium]
MNILIFSDSHGKQDNIREALSRQISMPDAVIFLGDGLRDLDGIDLGGIPLHSVCGNCDSMVAQLFDTPDEQLLFIGGKRIFITHGHKYHVKSLLSPIILRARELCADIVLFGHTHQALEMTLGEENQYGIKLEKPLLVMNPGSIGSYPYCFGSIDILKDGSALMSHGSLR